MTCSEQEEDLTPDEASGVLCRCGHLLTDNDLHFCGYCGSVIQVTSARRRAPAAVVSGRRAALAALASERNAVPVEPGRDEDKARGAIRHHVRDLARVELGVARDGAEPGTRSGKGGEGVRADGRSSRCGARTRTGRAGQGRAGQPPARSV